DNRADPVKATFYDIPPRKSTTQIPDNGYDGVAVPLEHLQVRTYPYLAHEFYYWSDPTAKVDPGNALGNGVFPHQVGGATDAGWHRMLEIFEVPSPVLDAIGPVAQGVNFDWYRQD